jgi:hypothetical protein
MGISEVEFYWVEMIAFVKIKIIVFTHPDIAALVTPLYASVKRGIIFFIFPALFTQRVERVVERSKDRVSQLCGYKLLSLTPLNCK